jgi:RimJ/RimL family protein N-acetyltransferase
LCTACLDTWEWGEHGTFVFQEGLALSQVNQLIRYSNDSEDTELQTYTRDHTRFATKGTYLAWYEKGPLIYALVHRESNALAAITWFRIADLPSQVSGPDHVSPVASAAYRSYIPYRGIGIMGRVARIARASFGARAPGLRVWLEVVERNAGAIRMYEKLGFIEIAHYQESLAAPVRIVMIEPA